MSRDGRGRNGGRRTAAKGRAKGLRRSVVVAWVSAMLAIGLLNGAAVLRPIQGEPPVGIASFPGAEYRPWLVS